MLKLIFLLISVAFTSQLLSKTITIGSGGDFTNLETAKATINPGDTIVILNQIFTNDAQFLSDLNGTETQPIVILAQTILQPIFRGGTTALHLKNCNYIELNGLVFEEQTANGVNIDDGGDYNTPSTNITVRNCIFRNMAESGNHDFLKLSGVDSFLVENCTFTSGTGGSGIDMVGCHNGIIQDCEFDDAGVSGIQCKGGSRHITIRGNILRNMSGRALNLGGSTGKSYFRPPLPSPVVNAFEAADINVFANIFIGNMAPVAYVGCLRVKVINNTFYKPEHWVIRILQETTDAGFLACSDNEFSNNIVYLSTDLTEVNIGPNTSPASFTFTNNLWFNKASENWKPTLPVSDPKQLIVVPLFTNGLSEDFTLLPNSPAIGSGQYFNDPAADFDKKLFSNPPSIGAYEGNPSTVKVSPIETHQNKVKVYPNPSSGIFSVDLGVRNEEYKYSVSDLNGRVIQSKSKLRKQRLTFKIEAPAGIYFLIIESKTRKEIFQLVKD